MLDIPLTVDLNKRLMVVSKSVEGFVLIAFGECHPILHRRNNLGFVRGYKFNLGAVYVVHGYSNIHQVTEYLHDGVTAR
ncbi:hypothetical protein D3C76_1123770 [compost metagenome]